MPKAKQLRVRGSGGNLTLQTVLLTPFLSHRSWFESQFRHLDAMGPGQVTLPL